MSLRHRGVNVPMSLRHRGVNVIPPSWCHYTIHGVNVITPLVVFISGVYKVCHFVIRGVMMTRFSIHLTSVTVELISIRHILNVRFHYTVYSALI